MSNVIKLRPALEPDEVLERAKGDFESVIVLGYDHNGDLDVRASLNIDHANVLWIIETFKLRLLGEAYHDDGQKS
jgi:hypothetical protein